jgi:hypothetical protein
MYYTHVNRNIIASNNKHGKEEPAVRFQKGRYGSPTYCLEVELPAGSRMVYKPSGKPLLPCGARLVIQSDEEPKVIR